MLMLEKKDTENQRTARLGRLPTMEELSLFEQAFTDNMPLEAKLCIFEGVLFVKHPKKLIRFAASHFFNGWMQNLRRHGKVADGGLEEFKTEVAGHKYTLWVDADGKIKDTACEGRWARTNVQGTGDAWLDGELQGKVDAYFASFRLSK